MSTQLTVPSLLRPLLDGNVVVLQLVLLTGSIPRMKKRDKHKVAPYVVLTPFLKGTLDKESDIVLVSIPEYGSSFVRPVTVRTMDLWRIGGLSTRACTLLSQELKMLFQ